ncbi:phosphoglycerate kinase [Flavobacterium aquicola]|uniref:Phosphoglycerate kinase n=2 Tax=Flavobacterium aquicola TaxID=1682742 RepID=A0A3E0E1K7_9FLAO|nr:phosphoglycerate kinase [Flavobacterium aquicola]
MTKMRNLMILVAGPYRSGTNDDPVLIDANVKAMTDTALALYNKGHLPVLGEWFALPLIEAAGSKEIGDAVFNQIFHPVAIQLINHCDGVLRIGGPSAGADEMVETGLAYGKTIYRNLEEIPEFKDEV